MATFDQIQPDELWVSFGTGSNFRYIAVHELVATLSPRQCLSLPVFHAITGCDTVSAFAGRGKKQPGKHGRSSQRLPMHSLTSFAWQII